MKMENPNKQEILNPKKIFFYYLDKVDLNTPHTISDLEFTFGLNWETLKRFLDEFTIYSKDGEEITIKSKGLSSESKELSSPESESDESPNTQEGDMTQDEIDKVVSFFYSISKDRYGNKIKKYRSLTYKHVERTFSKEDKILLGKFMQKGLVHNIEGKLVLTSWIRIYRPHNLVNKYPYPDPDLDL